VGWIESAVEYVIAFSDLRASPGGQTLSHETCAFCALLVITMPDPNVQTPTEFEIEKFLAHYDNPRKLQRSWLLRYLGQPRPQLAIDVIHAFDRHFKLKRATDLKLWILGGLVVAQWAVILELGHLLLERMVK
jgi:hypothetical protein